MEDNAVFRKVSLERLSSPEQLDALMTITRPMGWLALLGISIVVLAALIWAILGTIPTKVNSEGILLRGGGIRQIVPAYGGHLMDIRLEEGAMVRKGQVVASISQPELEAEMIRLNQELQAMEERLAALEREKNKLLQQGVGDGNATLLDNLEREIDVLILQTQQSRQELEDVRNNYLFRSRIISPSDGRVLEVRKKQGDYISFTEPLASYELTRGDLADLETILFVPAAEGQKILPGMEVQISPLFVNREEHGFMLGKVVSVSEFPVSSHGMMNLLENEELVKRFSLIGSPVEIRVDLIPDSNTPSGYRWSTGTGPPARLDSGTLITGAVIVQEQRPLSMIIPGL